MDEEGTDRPSERDMITQEAIKLASTLVFYAIILVIAHNMPWIEHQVWRIKTMKKRKKNAEEKFLRDVQREISLLDHTMEGNVG